MTKRKVNPENIAAIAVGWLEIVGLNRNVTAREMISLIIDNAENDSGKMMRSIIDACPEVAEQFRPKTLSRWLFNVENRLITIFDPETCEPIHVRFSAQRRSGTEVAWCITRMPSILQHIVKSSSCEDASPLDYPNVQDSADITA
jgi:hypothetical protein